MKRRENKGMSGHPGLVGRRRFLGAAALLGSGLAAPNAFGQMPAHRFEGYDFGSPANARDRLDQGPFSVEQDAGWRTLATTTSSNVPARNYGLGLVGYTWEENGPALAVRRGEQSLEQAIEEMASLPFTDVLYIRCDWRNVQSQAGRLHLDPVWELTLDAARRYGLRVAFRVQLSNPEFQPDNIALPEFLREKIPLSKIGRLERHGRMVDFVEPRYDHPAFQKAFRELNELLAARFENEPLVEWMDLMQYGFWGEGHTSDLPNPFPDYLTARRTFLAMTELQIATWKKTPLAVNTEPDISAVGNNEVLDMAIRAGCWLRSDSIIHEEPMQIEELANRPPWLPVIMEDGYLREYDITRIPLGPAGINLREEAMLHVLDLGANYWSLWTEAKNLARYHERFPRGFDTLRSRMGYRVRPAWIWQRKRYSASEVIVAVANTGVSALPGVLRLTLSAAGGGWSGSGTLDPGHPYGGKLREAAFLIPREMEGKEVRLSAALETRGGVVRPIRWTCEQPLNPDGSFSIMPKGPQDPGWLKGV